MFYLFEIIVVENVYCKIEVLWINGKIYLFNKVFDLYYKVNFCYVNNVL